MTVTAEVDIGKVGTDGTVFHHPLGAVQFYRGMLVSQYVPSHASAGKLVPSGLAGAGPSIGRIQHTILGDGSATSRGVVESNAVYRIPFGSGVNALSESTPFGTPVYAYDANTVYKTDVGGTLKLAGYFVGMEQSSESLARIFVPLVNFSAGSAGAGSIASPTLHAVRGASTANTSLSAFTVAGVDGLTYAEGERILLKNQSTASENGIYVVGTVAAGVAPLTRAVDFDESSESVSGALVHVSEGTLNLDSYWQLTTNGIPSSAIVIGTTNLTFAKIPNAVDLASTSSGLGAALIGVQDSAGVLAAATAEAALAELAVEPDKGTDLTDADATVQPTAGVRISWRRLPAATLSAGRSLTLGTTGAVAGMRFIITRIDATANTFAIVNGGGGAGTLVTMPASKINFAIAQYDGTNWLLKACGTQ